MLVDKVAFKMENINQQTIVHNVNVSIIEKPDYSSENGAEWNFLYRIEQLERCNDINIKGIESVSFYIKDPDNGINVTYDLKTINSMDSEIVIDNNCLCVYTNKITNGSAHDHSRKQ